VLLLGQVLRMTENSKAGNVRGAMCPMLLHCTWGE
jgi:hypothetical protein